MKCTLENGENGENGEKGVRATYRNQPACAAGALVALQQNVATLHSWFDRTERVSDRVLPTRRSWRRYATGLKRPRLRSHLSLRQVFDGLADVMSDDEDQRQDVAW